MLTLEAELVAIAYSTCSDSLHFCIGYWPLSLHSSSAEACGIIFPEGVHVPTMVLQGQRNAIAYFQSNVPSWFLQMQNSFKS